MKKVELAVKKVIQGKPVLNKDALRNPEALDFMLVLRSLVRIRLGLRHKTRSMRRISKSDVRHSMFDV
jgi:hypothetical protein